MQFLPIAERELRVAARRSRTYRVRLIAGGLAILIAGYIYWFVAEVFGETDAGRRILAILTHLAFLYCLFGGVHSTADSLSREKREGTLGLLFLSGLRSSQIISGKLAATSLHVTYGLVGAIPVFALCLAMGGVNPGEVWRIVLALANCLFLSLSVGLLVSSASRQERRAVQTASFVMVAIGFVLPAAGRYLRTNTSALEAGLFLESLSPINSLQLSLTPTTGLRAVWISLLRVHLLAWLAFGSACVLLPYFWQDRPILQRGLVPSVRHRWPFRSPPRRLTASPVLDKNPFYWLATRSSRPVWEVWIVFVVSVLLAIATGWYFRTSIAVFLVCMILGIMLHTVAKLSICATACDRLAREKEDRTLEALLSTPLKIADILRGQSLALVRQFGGFLAALALLDFCMLVLVIALRESDFFSSPDAVMNCIALFAAGVTTLVMDAIALSWVGMWRALVARRPDHARAGALFCILVVPWLILAFCLMIVLPQPELRAVHLIAVWFAVGMLNSVIFTVLARWKLFHDFRLLASRQGSRS